MLPSKLVTQALVIFGLILASSHVGECSSSKMMSPMYEAPESDLVPSPAPAEALAPTSAPGPAPAAAPGPAINPGGPIMGPSGTPGLKLGFYKGKCHNVVVDVEAIIQIKIKEIFFKDPTVLPALLWLTFHDCFVTGCDASLTINGTSTEMTNDANLSVRGYDVIEAMKSAVEAECPGVVSCSDIIALSTGFAIQLGGGPAYAVETGRRDGLVSNSSDVILPTPTMTVPDSAALFATKNFTAEEMAILLGAHAVGIAHCKKFQDRLYNSTNQFDPLMDTKLRSQLRETCPQTPVTGNFTHLNQDPKNNNTVDNSFYNQLRLNRGILSIDQALARHSSTSDLVYQLAINRTMFNIKFANAMIKLQALDVLTGNKGEIRNVCSKFN